jgi:hypothetical protein
MFHDLITVLIHHGCIYFEALVVRAAAMLYKKKLRFYEDMNSRFKLPWLYLFRSVSSTRGRHVIQEEAKVLRRNEQ